MVRGSSTRPAATDGSRRSAGRAPGPLREGAQLRQRAVVVAGQLRQPPLGRAAREHGVDAACQVGLVLRRPRPRDGERRPVRPEHVRGRDFTVLAYADELIASPDMLRAYGTAFGGADRATLVIHAPGADPDALEEQLGPVVQAVGMASDDSADLLAVAGPRTTQHETYLARGGRGRRGSRRDGGRRPRPRRSRR